MRSRPPGRVYGRKGVSVREGPGARVRMFRPYDASSKLVPFAGGDERAGRGYGGGAAPFCALVLGLAPTPL